MKNKNKSNLEILIEEAISLALDLKKDLKEISEKLEYEMSDDDDEEL